MPRFHQDPVRNAFAVLLDAITLPSRKAHAHTLYSLVGEDATATLQRLVDSPDECLRILDEEQRARALQLAGVQKADVENFPPDLREPVSTALILFKPHVDYTPLRPLYVAAIRPNGLLLVANEPQGEIFLNEWPRPTV